MEISKNSWFKCGNILNSFFCTEICSYRSAAKLAFAFTVFTTNPHILWLQIFDKNLWKRTSLCWVGSKTEELWQRYSCQVIGALVIVILSSPQTVPWVWDFCRWVYWVWVKKKSNIFEKECTYYYQNKFFHFWNILIAL